MSTRAEVTVLPVLTDNYSYLLQANGLCLVVDPADAQAVRREVSRHETRLTHIAITHHHGDHTAGCTELVREYGCRVIGPTDPSLPCVDMPVQGGETLNLGGCPVAILATPGHTRSHVAYHFPTEGILFTGDALFVCGCGRAQEGGFADMWASMLALRALPDETRVYCGHNYTVDNMEFALHLDPDNTGLSTALAAARLADAAHQPTVPTRIDVEKRLNPFLRCDAPDLNKALGISGSSPEDVFEHIRRRKDRW